MQFRVDGEIEHVKPPRFVMSASRHYALIDEGWRRATSLCKESSFLLMITVDWAKSQNRRYEVQQIDFGRGPARALRRVWLSPLAYLPATRTPVLATLL